MELQRLFPNRQFNLTSSHGYLATGVFSGVEYKPNLSPPDDNEKSSHGSVPLLRPELDTWPEYQWGQRLGAFYPPDQVMAEYDKLCATFKNKKLSKRSLYKIMLMLNSIWEGITTGNSGMYERIVSWNSVIKSIKESCDERNKGELEENLRENWNRPDNLSRKKKMHERHAWIRCKDLESKLGALSREQLTALAECKKIPASWQSH